MALDALTLHLLCGELRQKVLGGRITKIHQLSKEELVLTLSGQGEIGGKLFLSARADAPRIHLTGEQYPNPATPPMFCMLLRKHLSGGRLADIRQPEGERIAFLDFDCRNEIGDAVRLSLVIEIMGRHSNIVLLTEDGTILDAVKRVDMSMSSVRQILPTGKYTLPPAQNKLWLLSHSKEELAEAVAARFDGDLHRACMKTLAGISPVVAGEIEHYVTKGGPCGELTSAQLDRLRFFLGQMQELVTSGDCAPTVVLDAQKAPKDFSFMELHQFGYPFETRHYPTLGEMLDAFYTGKDAYHRVKQRSADLFHLLMGRIERIERRVTAQREELTACAQREELRVRGDLLQSALYQIQKGDRVAKVTNYYSEAGETVEIPLDARLTPAQNAQAYYKKYRKLCTAEEKLKALIEQGEEEIRYLESVFDSLTRATGEDELAVIRQELCDQGYLRRAGKKGNRPKMRGPLEFVLDDGYTLLVGRNNTQNDQLTTKLAEKTDIWFHTKDIAGSHAILLTGGEDFDAIPVRAFTQAATIAATHSKAGDAAQVAVDYTLVKNIKKPAGAKPGMVVFEQNYSAYVTPDPELCRRLQKK